MAVENLRKFICFCGRGFPSVWMGHACLSFWFLDSLSNLICQVISYWAHWCFDMTVASTYWLIYSSISTSRSSRSLRSSNTRPQALMTFLPVPVFKIWIWAGGPGVWSLWWIPRVLLASITHQSFPFASFCVWSWTVIATMELVKVVPEIAIVKESIVFFASSGHSLHSNVMSQLMS